jgi:signal transduction histidine kinase/CheY-like chemotaxis protein
VVGAYLVQRFAGGTRAFERAPDFLRFVLAGLLAGTVSATIGVASLVGTSHAAWSAASPIWLTWWLGDAAGAVIVAPLIVLWAVAPRLGPLRERAAEAALLLVILGVTGWLVFHLPALGAYPLPFLCIPPLIWAAFRFGPREVATSVAFLAAIATWATVRGSGPFAMATENESLLLLQSFMATIIALTLPVAALMSERRAIEQERALLLQRERAARAEAEAASHMKDEFLAMLSHELRNPLAAIGNAAQVLQQPAAGTAFVPRAAEIISRQTKHLSRLIEDLLDVARVSTGKVMLTRDRINLADTVQASLAILRSAGRLEQHRWSSELAPAWVEADPARLSQIVDNLLLNAIKYTPAGGSIDVHTSSERDAAVLRVRDTGIGIAPDLLPRMFELFVQGPRSIDRAQGGLGVGLTLAQRLAEAHGGTLTAASDGPDRGSTFTLRLPQLEEPEAAVPADSQAIVQPRSRRILIVEDDADGREALQMQLELAGHRVFTAADGLAGLSIAARVQPEVVLLDIGLPKMDGYQLAQQLRDNVDRPRLIAITGYGQPRDRQRAIDAGIDYLLVKPIDAAELDRLLA